MLSNKLAFCVIKAILSGMVIFAAQGMQPSYARDLSAKALSDMPDAQQRYMFIAGIVAGLSTARYVADGHDTGSACIDRWFYDSGEARAQIEAAFAGYGDRSPSAIIYALISRACGK